MDNENYERGILNVRRVVVQACVCDRERGGKRGWGDKNWKATALRMGSQKKSACKRRDSPHNKKAVLLQHGGCVWEKAGVVVVVGGIMIFKVGLKERRRGLIEVWGGRGCFVFVFFVFFSFVLLVLFWRRNRF